MFFLNAGIYLQVCMVLQARRPTSALVLGLNKLFYSEVVRKFITNSVNQGDTVLEVAEM
jgi:hypothetical protein